MFEVLLVGVLPQGVRNDGDHAAGTAGRQRCDLIEARGVISGRIESTLPAGSETFRHRRPHTGRQARGTQLGRIPGGHIVRMDFGDPRRFTDRNSRGQKLIDVGCAFYFSFFGHGVVFCC